jgi:branched-chain amino acid transport system ATP-binding protein
MLLEVDGLDVAYGDFQVLWDVSIQVGEAEIVALLGPNGAGKSTLMNTISGLLSPRRGTVTLAEQRIDGLPAHRIVGHGIAHVLERRRLFPFLTVRDNVLLGAHHRTSSSSFPCCATAKASSPTRSRAASSRWSPSRAASWHDRDCS